MHLTVNDQYVICTAIKLFVHEATRILSAQLCHQVDAPVNCKKKKIKKIKQVVKIASTKKSFPCSVSSCYLWQMLDTLVFKGYTLNNMCLFYSADQHWYNGRRKKWKRSNGPAVPGLFTFVKALCIKVLYKCSLLMWSASNSNCCFSPWRGREPVYYLQLVILCRMDTIPAHAGWEMGSQSITAHVL